MKVRWPKKGIVWVFLFHISFVFSQSKEPSITWTDSLKLTWNLFQDQPDTNTEVVAITASGLAFHYSIQKRDDKIVGFTTYIETSFYPKKSWYKPEKANAHILSHEQLHFDITEWHARKFREQISKLKISEKLTEHLDAIHQQIQKDLKTMQNLYDSETDYSRNTEAQTQWQHRVKDELYKLSEYKS